MPACRCVAAHSTVRALYGKYNGPLYTVTTPDGKSANISTLAAGGYADIDAHDKFCGKTNGNCVISFVIDQSPQGNHLGQCPALAASPPRAPVQHPTPCHCAEHGSGGAPCFARECHPGPWHGGSALATAR